MMYTFFNNKGDYQVLSISIDGYTTNILESVLRMGFTTYEVIKPDGKIRRGETQELLNSCKAFVFK